MKLINRFLLTAVLLFTVLFLNKPADSFGGAGPFTHASITRLAAEEFASDSGKEINFTCLQMIIQANIEVDAHHAQHDYFHCDNNNIVSCSYHLADKKNESMSQLSLAFTMQKIGIALHVIQDFYSHSNWAETFGAAMVTAPLEQFKDFHVPQDIQTGFFPDITLDMELQLMCFLVPEEEWSRYIPMATHACLNKDSNLTMRGSRLTWNTGGMTLHELAGLYAVKHSVKLFREMAANNYFFQTCLLPKIGGGCASYLSRRAEASFF